MRCSLVFLFLFLFGIFQTCSNQQYLMDELKNYAIDDNCKISESCATRFLDFFNFVYQNVYQIFVPLLFELNVNFNGETLNKALEISSIVNELFIVAKNKSQKFIVSDCWNSTLKRQMMMARKNFLFYDAEQEKEFTELVANMGIIYSTAKLFDNQTQTSLPLDPDLTKIMTDSRDYDRLLWVWKGWHDLVGKQMRNNYTRTVELSKIAAQQNGYADYSEYWIFDFEDKNFEKDYDRLYEEIKPLYQELHAYARRKLKDFYGAQYPQNLNPKLIPAHLLGNMWAQTWDNTYSLLVPYPDLQPLNLTKNLIEKNYTVDKMLRTSEEFYASIGLYKMPPSFWNSSMFVRPNDREVECQPISYDFYNGYDYRISMCASVNQLDFYIIHNQLGKIEYFMAYRDQPVLFQNGANSAFNGVIGETTGLSFQSTKHLNTLGLVDKASMNDNETINYLMLKALEKVAFLPFGYLIDKWRWDVFRGKINDSNYNQKWWEMREKYQGIQAPVERSEEHFDPGAKFHIPNYVSYSQNFISYLLQFQIYESLCEISGHQGPLYNCDFYNSKEVGKKLEEMMKLGSSKHWSYQLKQLTGKSYVSAAPFINYFKPLHDWLILENAKNNETPGF